MPPLTPVEESMLALVPREAVESHCGVRETKDDDPTNVEHTGSTQQFRKHSCLFHLYAELVLDADQYVHEQRFILSYSTIIHKLKIVACYLKCFSLQHCDI